MQQAQPNPKRQRNQTIIYLGTAVLALVLNRGLGVPIVFSFLLGFAIIAVGGLATLALASARRRRSDPPDPN